MVNKIKEREGLLHFNEGIMCVYVSPVYHGETNEDGNCPDLILFRVFHHVELTRAASELALKRYSDARERALSSLRS